MFTLGSAVWVINGFFVFLPSFGYFGANASVIGWTAFVGGTIFEVGSYFMVVEALNRKQVVIPLSTRLKVVMFWKSVSFIVDAMYPSFPQLRQRFK